MSVFTRRADTAA